MLALLTAVLSAFAALPQVFAQIEKFVLILVEALAEAKRKQLEKDMKDSTEKAQTTKDTSDLDAMFDPGKKKP